MKSLSISANRRSIRRHLLGGLTVISLLVGVVGGWAATMNISGAVIGSGVVIVETSDKKIQHPTGGVVGKIFVHDGDRVRAGDILVQLSDTVPRANLALISRALDELYARKARLLAERDGMAQIQWPRTLLDRIGNSEIADHIASEQKLFEFRHIVLLGNKAGLTERIQQLGQEIEGNAAQATSKAKEFRLINIELDLRNLAFVLSDL